MPARIRRVFHDEDELPASADLSRAIDEALEASRFLIVVCSTRTPESRWVNQEIVRFREMGRSDLILALLVEGEPGEALPVAPREIRTCITGEGGVTREEIEEVEQLAADGFQERWSRISAYVHMRGELPDVWRDRLPEQARRRIRYG